MAGKKTTPPKPEKRPTSLLLAVGGVVIAMALVYAGFTVYGAREQSARAAGAVEQLRVTLNPDLFNGKARRAYEVAAKHPALLAKLHCYCGCERNGWMHNLLDCYRTMHASHCPICIGEALEAEQLASQGVPITKIRQELKTRFDHGE